MLIKIFDNTVTFEKTLSTEDNYDTRNVLKVDIKQTRQTKKMSLNFPFFQNKQ